AKFESRIKPEVADSIWVCDLKPLGIKNYGDATDLGKRPELFAASMMFHGGTRQQLARGPNKDFLRSGKAIGPTKTEQTWDGQGTKEGIFEFVGDSEQLDRWKNEPDLRLHGYWFWDWAEDYGKVDSIDTEAKKIKMQEPYHGYGYHDDFRYYAENALCELDTPGEWYLDRDTETLLWFVPEKVDTKTFNGVRISCFDAPFMLEIRDASNIIVSDLSFWESRDSGIKIENSTNCVLSKVGIFSVGRNGIDISGGYHNGVSECSLVALGAGGMTISGGDRKTLTPGNHYVQDTLVLWFSVLKPTYTPAVLLSGCGHRISHCMFGDSGSSAMRLEGNDFLIEYNRIEKVVNESDDQGGIDTWYNPSYRGITIRYNYWKDITGGTKCGAAGIRLDDMISDVTIYGNVFENCGSALFGAVQIHGGKDNIVENNVMLDCFLAVSFSPWGQKRYLEALDGEFVKNKLYNEVNIDSDVFKQKYPNLAKIRENADVNTVSHNLIVNSKNEKIWRDDNGNQKMEGNVILQMKGENDEILKEILNPEFLKKHGLKPIPFDEIAQ
ncbi:MAG: right-handed parallel beta-helix repeat-containing protein, partial [Thermoguttaceae bacterium]